MNIINIFFFIYETFKLTITSEIRTCYAMRLSHIHSIITVPLGQLLAILKSTVNQL